MIRAFVVAVIVLVATASTARAETVKAMLLLKSSANGHSAATFGRSATDGGTMGRTLSSVLRDAGASLVSAGATVPRLGEVPRGLPLGDQAALEMARSAHARVVVIVGASSREAGVIRATSLVVQRAHVSLRVLDVASGQVLLSQTVQQSGYGSDAAQAAALASSTALSDLNSKLGDAVRVLATGASKPVQGSLQITITGATGWAPIAAVLGRLAGTQRVQAIHVLRIEADRVLLGVSSPLSIPSIVGSLRRTRVRSGSISVQASRAGIVIQVRPPLTPLVNG